MEVAILGRMARWAKKKLGGESPSPGEAPGLRTRPSGGVARFCPETCIVFVSYGRPRIAASSYRSLATCLEPFRDRVKVVISDATDDPEKMEWARGTDADDVILTPRFTSAATSRNLAMTLVMDKYSPTFLCMVEDDIEYSTDWYPTMIESTGRLYGVVSPFGLAYGIFSALDAPAERCKRDEANGVTAYIFGAVADQRFMPTFHYQNVMREWDPDLLGISYAQTGGQTFRNTMRGFCGALVPGGLCRRLAPPEESTWVKKREAGPPAHSFLLDDYKTICDAASDAGTFEDKDEA